VAKVKVRKAAELFEDIRGLRMVQVIPINMIDGNTGLAGLTTEGQVYTYTGTGWVKLNMVEVQDDNKV
jgi:hypothetical protein